MERGSGSLAVARETVRTEENYVPILCGSLLLSPTEFLICFEDLKRIAAQNGEKIKVRKPHDCASGRRRRIEMSHVFGRWKGDLRKAGSVNSLSKAWIHTRRGEICGNWRSTTVAVSSLLHWKVRCGVAKFYWEQYTAQNVEFLIISEFLVAEKAGVNIYHEYSRLPETNTILSTAYIIEQIFDLQIRLGVSVERLPPLSRHFHSISSLFHPGGKKFLLSARKVVPHLWSPSN